MPAWIAALIVGALCGAVSVLPLSVLPLPVLPLPWLPLLLAAGIAGALAPGWLPELRRGAVACGIGLLLAAGVEGRIGGAEPWARGTGAWAAPEAGAWVALAVSVIAGGGLLRGEIRERQGRQRWAAAVTGAALLARGRAILVAPVAGFAGAGDTGWLLPGALAVIGGIGAVGWIGAGAAGTPGPEGGGAGGGGAGTVPRPWVSASLAGWALGGLIRSGWVVAPLYGAGTEQAGTEQAEGAAEQAGGGCEPAAVALSGRGDLPELLAHLPGIHDRIVAVAGAPGCRGTPEGARIAARVVRAAPDRDGAAALIGEARALSLGWRPQALRGDPAAAVRVAGMLDAAGRAGEALRLLRRHPRGGAVDAWGALLERQGAGGGPIPVPGEPGWRDRWRGGEAPDIPVLRAGALPLDVALLHDGYAEIRFALIAPAAALCLEGEGERYLEPPELEIRLDGRAAGVWRPEAGPGAALPLSARALIGVSAFAPGPHRISLRFTNDLSGPCPGDPARLCDRNAYVRALRVGRCPDAGGGAGGGAGGAGGAGGRSGG